MDETVNRGATMPLPARVTCGNGYLWDEAYNAVADASPDDEGLVRARGWGYLTGTGGLNLTNNEAATYQDRILERVALAYNSHDELLAALKQIARMTNGDDPESYRSDDREGCFDTVYAVACEAIAKAEAKG